MPEHSVRKCTKCFHPLPFGRLTWRPFWSLWSEAIGERLTYAADGPPLGYVIEFSGERLASAVPSENKATRHWRAWALLVRPTRGGAWPYMTELMLRRGTLREAKRAVEQAVRDRGLWDSRRCP